MAMRSPGKVEYILPNGWAAPYADGDINGPWLFNYTTGSITNADTPGGAFALVGTAAESDIMEILGPLVFEVDAGLPITVEAEIQVQTDASTAAAVFFGFTDRRDKTEEPAIEDEDGTLESDATDALGIMLEAEQDATWQAVSVANGTDGAQTPLTDAADYVVGTWQKLQVSIVRNIDGVAQAEFYIDGKKLSHTRTAAVTSSVRLAPVITLDERNAAVTVWVRNLRALGPGAES